MTDKDGAASEGGNSPSGRTEKNIDISRLGPSRRLRALRTKLNLTQADLAHKAGLTPRTVRDIERGRRKRVQEKTLMMLAEALGTSFEELVGPAATQAGATGPGASTSASSAYGGRGDGASTPDPPAHSGPDPGDLPVGGATRTAARPDAGAFTGGAARTTPNMAQSDAHTAGRTARARWRLWPPCRRVLVAVAVLAAVALAAWGLRVKAVRSATWTIEGGTLEVYDGLLGFKLWGCEEGSRINFCRKSPWTEDVLLVGRCADTPEGGGLVALAAASGDTLWEVRPAPKPFFEAFDSSMVGAACFDCWQVSPSDVNGDGHPEVVAYFRHTRYYPSCLCLIDENGRLLRQYCHRGFLYAFCVDDIDSDGKDEVLAGGINNARAYRGATMFILDEEHWAGASVDSLSPAVGSIGDSCLVRAVFPRFDDVFMAQVGDLYIGTHEIKVLRSEENRVVIDAMVGACGCDLVLVLDGELHPLSVDIADNFLSKIQAWPDSLRSIPNPSDLQWRQAWLARHHRYQYGL